MSDGHAPSGAASAAMIVMSSSAPRTQLLGRAIGMALREGDVVLLQGELGAGKTCMVQGMAAGVGALASARSPTFVLVNEYQGRIRLNHCDLYRIGGPEEVQELALEERLHDGALAVEWPERAGGSLPQDSLLVQIEIDPMNDVRTVTMTPLGKRAARLIGRVAGVWGALEAASETGSRP